MAKTDKRKITSPQNGKKGGRPEGSFAPETLEKKAFEQHYRERMKPHWDDIIDAQIEKASLGSERILEEINNRMMGKPVTPIATSDGDGNILPFQIIVKQQDSGNDRSKPVS